MQNTDKRIDTYIENAETFAKPILIHLRKLIHDACPEVVETWKWSFPVFIYKGAIMCNMAAFKKHCAFGFWKAAMLQDNDKILSLQERTAMGHLGKITCLADLPSDDVLKKYIKETMKLNEQDIKLPPKPKPTTKEKAALFTPDYLTAALTKNPIAKEVFEKFSYSHKKEYIEWLADAKTEVTRNKRMAQAMDWIAKGKGRNWKYEKC